MEHNANKIKRAQTKPARNLEPLAAIKTPNQRIPSLIPDHDLQIVKHKTANSLVRDPGQKRKTSTFTKKR